MHFMPCGNCEQCGTVRSYYEEIRIHTQLPKGWEISLKPLTPKLLEVVSFSAAYQPLGGHDYWI